MHPRLILTTFALLLASCHLIDQRDFNSAAGRPPAPKVLPPGPPPAPSLVTIRYTTPDPQYRDAVAALVTQALARKRDVLFTITTLTADASDTAAESGREVAQAIVDDGAEPGQVEQMLRVDPALAVKEVRIDVR